MEHITNMQILYMFLLLIGMAVLCAGLNLLWMVTAIQLSDVNVSLLVSDT